MKHFTFWRSSFQGFGILFSAPTIVLFAYFIPQTMTFGSFFLNHDFLFEHIYNTLILWLIAGGMATIVGAMLAWMVSTRQFSGKKWIARGLILPLAFPSYILAYTYQGLVEYTGGLRQGLAYICNVSTLDIWLPEIMNLQGMMFIFFIGLYPYSYLLCLILLNQQKSHILETSRNLNVSVARSFFKVSIPLLRPGIFGGFLLITMEILNDYGIAAYYGVRTLTSGITETWLLQKNLPLAAQMFFCVISFVIFNFALENHQRKNKRYSGNYAKIYRPQRLIPSKSLHANILPSIGGFILIFFGFLFPFGQLLYWAQFGCSFILMKQVAQAFITTLMFSCVASCIILFLGGTIVFGMQMFRSPRLSSWFKIINLNYGLPGTFLGISMILITLNISFLGIPLTNWIGYGTPGAFLAGYVFRFFPVAFNGAQSGSESFGRQFRETSFTLGKPPLETLKKVVFPLNKKTLFVVWLLSFVDVIKDLSLSIMTQPFNLKTLSIQTYHFIHDENLQASAFPALCIVGITLFVLSYSKLDENPNC